jgi:U3 small nucleolar RNA-associated protein 12
MAKSYFAFEHKQAFGHIISPNTNFLLSSDDKRLYTTANEHLQIWSTKSLTLISSQRVSDASLTFLTRSNDKLALGDSRGKITILSLQSLSKTHSFEGHTGAITSLAFSSDGLMLASGCNDTSIIIWDLVADSATVKFQGHKDAVTGVIFEGDSLVSCSKDRTIKYWDISSQYCYHTLVTNREVWSIDTLHSRLYAGCGDQYLHIWENIDGKVEEKGVLTRQLLKGRTRKVAVHKLSEVIAVQSSNDIEFFRLKTQKEIDKLVKRRRKRRREKGKDEEDDLLFPDYYTLLTTLKSSQKISSFSFFNRSYKSSTHSKCIKLAISLNNNSIEFHEIHYSIDKSTPYSALFETLDLLGHRSSSKFVSLSKDSNILMSASTEALKFWDIQSQNCVGTVPFDNANCGMWLYGEQYVILGSKSGLLAICDIYSQNIVWQKQAHKSNITSLRLSPVPNILISAGSDQDIKYWRLMPDKKIRLKMFEVFTLRDEILSTRFSPNGRFLCASLLDSTIQVFYSDTKKLNLNLYGHKLPVTCFDISYDSQLLISGSSDKNVKIWGLDYGDCHRSLIAHDSPVSDIKFLPESHFFISAGRDRLIKYWDADSAQCISTLVGHTAEVWGLVVSHMGDFFVSTGNDFSLRIWVLTDQQIFLEEQREKEIEDNIKPSELGIQESRGEAVALLATTKETLTVSEQLIEALDIAKQYREHISSGGTELPPYEFQGSQDWQFILKKLKSIRTSLLDSALQVLPYEYAIELINHLERILDREADIETVSRCILFLIKLHENRLLSSAFSADDWLLRLESLHSKLQSRIRSYKNLVGRNLAACKWVSRYIEDIGTRLETENA